MNLSTIQIMTLLQIDRNSTKDIFTIVNYVCCNCSMKINSLTDLLDLIKNLKEEHIINQFPEVNLDDFKKGEDKAKQIFQTKKEQGISLFSYYEKEYPNRLRSRYDANGLLISPLLYQKSVDEPSEKGYYYITIPEVQRLVEKNCPNCPNIIFLKD